MPDMIVSTGFVAGLDPKRPLSELLGSLKADIRVPSAVDGSVDSTVKLFINLSSREKIDAHQIAGFLPQNSKFIISLGLDFNNDDSLSSDQVELLKVLFGAAKPSGAILGVTDFSAQRLEDLQNRLGPDIRIHIDNINAAECCALPPDILTYSRQHNVQLLAHHDPVQILQNNDVDVINASTGAHASSWTYVLRIMSAYSGRQVIAGTEYIIALQQ